jgi:hypothetical protein
MNFKGVRDFTPFTKRYRSVVVYLMDIQFNYPDLFKLLTQTPQFEYEVEACRDKIRFATRYLSILELLVQGYCHEKKLDVKKTDHQHDETAVMYPEKTLKEILPYKVARYFNE